MERRNSNGSTVVDEIASQLKNLMEGIPILLGSLVEACPSVKYKHD
jgi:hypothetical protein